MDTVYQYSIGVKTRGGVSNVFLTYYDNFFRRGQYKLGAWEAPQGVKPPDKSSTAVYFGQAGE